eukprot:5269469-Pleurochrysis_carterae.AAC.1
MSSSGSQVTSRPYAFRTSELSSSPATITIQQYVRHSTMNDHRHSSTMTSISFVRRSSSWKHYTA